MSIFYFFEIFTRVTPQSCQNDLIWSLYLFLVLI